MHRCPDGGRTPARERFAFTPDGIARRASGKQDWQGFEGNSAMIAAAFPRQIPANPVFRSDLSVNSLISLANLSALRLAYRNAYDDKRREADRRVFYALAPRSSKASILNVPTSKTGQRPRFSPVFTRAGICSVAVPRRCPRIACVAAPCICPRDARNAAPPNTRTGSWLAASENYTHMRDTGLLQSLYRVDPPTARTWNM